MKRILWRVVLGMTAAVVMMAFATVNARAEISSLYVQIDSCNEYIFMSNSENGKMRVLHHNICAGGCWDDSGWVDPILIEDPPAHFPDHVEVNEEGSYLISVGTDEGGEFDAGTGPSCRGFTEDSSSTAVLPVDLTGYGLE